MQATKKTILKFQQIPTKEGVVLQESKNIKSNFDNFSDKQLFTRDFIDYYLGKQSGMIVLLPKGQRLLNALIEILNENITRKFNFSEYSLPKMITPAICRQAKIMGKWDDYLMSVTPYGFTKGEKKELIIDPLQCTPLYAYLSNRKINSNKLPLKILDVSGPTYRNEDKSTLIPLIKQMEFRRMEFIYFDKPSGVIKIRENMLTQLESVCAKLNIPFRRVIGGGCYEMTSTLLQKPADNLDEMPIIDLEMKLTKPFKKRNKELDYLEVVGASVLKNQQTKRFNIKIANSKDQLWSGCVGIGLNRLIYVFLSNNGFNENKWPNEIKKYLK